MTGHVLGQYRLEEKLGAGAMGEVYRARDEKLNRDVAVKVLPAGALSDEAARRRFRKEANVLSRISHPHIATIHDFDSADGIEFLVMELVPGPSIDEALRRGPFPEKDVVRLGGQMARGLQAAHEQGVIHRDLKPSNLRLTPDGMLKILDFGVARLEQNARRAAGDATATETADGQVVGTLPYMSPEQLRGRGVDERSDLYAAGAVLYEMATGRKVFPKPSAAELTEAILNENPAPPREVNEGVSPGLESVILKALDKDPELRYQTAKDLRADLERLQLRSSSGSAASRSVPDLPGRADAGPETAGTAPGDREASMPAATLARRPRRRERLAWAIAALAIGAAALFAWREMSRTPEGRPLVRFAVDVPASFPLHNAHVAVSPDGRHVAFSTFDAGPPGIWVRSLESHEGRPLPVPDEAHQPFWSPDSRSLAYFTMDSLDRIRLADGVVETICTVPEGWAFQGGTWAGDTILFSASERLLAVPESGGEPEPVEVPRSQGATAFWWPEFLPDGRRFLYTASSPTGERPGILLSSLDRPEESTMVLPGVWYARYARSGHLLFVQGGTLLAQPFDLIRRAAVGEPSVVASPVTILPIATLFPTALFSASPSGVLVYSEEEGASLELTWFDGKGTRLETLGAPNRYSQIQLSPDGRRVAAQISGEGGQDNDIWTLDVRRGVATRITSDPGLDSDPVWSPDGQTLFFVSGPGGNAMRLHRKRLDGSGPVSLVHDPSVAGWSEAVSPDGASLLYLTGTDPNDSLWAAPLDAPGDPELLLTVKEGVEEPQVSPDGRWLLYCGNDSGSWEVYLAPFRREGERERVSTNGGRQPKWRGDGREVFYVTPRGQLMAVDVKETNGRLAVGLPEPLFNAGVNSPFHDQYAVTGDGQRFLVITPFFEGGSQSFQVVLNWPELLE